MISIFIDLLIIIFIDYYWVRPRAGGHAVGPSGKYQKYFWDIFDCFFLGLWKPSKGIPIRSNTKILGPIKIFMLRGRQKLECFNNKQNVFKEREREKSLLRFHNPLQLRKQPAFTSPLSARLFQPPNGRQRLRLATFFLPTEAPPGLVMQCTTCLLTCATCVKPVPCDFSSAMPGVLGRRGFLVTEPVAFRRSTRLLYTCQYAAGHKWPK